MSTSPYRSVLYMPGSNARALEKARNLPADALILDLEDAVAPSEKLTARKQVVAALKQGGFGYRKRIVRINGMDTDWGTDDLEAALAAQPDAILLPKVSTSDQLMAVAGRITCDTRLWAMMETPEGMLNAVAIAAATPRLEAFVMGTNDLLKDIGAESQADRQPLITGLGLCLLAGKAHGLVCIDGVYNAFRDEDGLRAECQQGRAMGFDGKTLIHPAQLAVTNEVFSPSDDQITLARAQVAAFEAAKQRGEGVAVLDGRIVENLHVEAARRTLSKAEAIARQVDQDSEEERL